MALTATITGASAVGPTSGGKVYAFNNLTTTPLVVAPANVSRASITFDNPGSVDVIVFPSLVQALNSVATIANVTLTPTTTSLGGGYRIFGNGGTRTITGECQGAWQALAISGSGNPLTVTDSNVP